MLNAFRILITCSSLNRFFRLIIPSAFYHIVINFSIGSVFGVQVKGLKLPESNCDHILTMFNLQIPDNLINSQNAVFQRISGLLKSP